MDGVIDVAPQRNYRSGVIRLIDVSS